MKHLAIFTFGFFLVTLSEPRLVRADHSTSSQEWVKVQKSNAYVGAAKSCGTAIPKSLVAGLMAIMEPVLILFYSNTSAFSVNPSSGQLSFSKSSDALAREYMDKYVYQFSGLGANQECRGYLRQIFQSEVAAREAHTFECK